MKTYVVLNNIFLLLCVASNLALSFFIFFKNRKAPINIAFSAFLLAVSFWALSFFIFVNVSSPEWILLARRMTPVGASFIAGLFLYFSWVFPREVTKANKLFFVVCVLPAVVFSLASIFTPYMVEDFFANGQEYLFVGQPVFGFFYSFFSVYFISFFLLGLFFLIAKTFVFKGKERLQLFYVLLGVICAGLPGIALSLLMPLLGFYGFFTLGPLATFVMACFIAYAIAKYNLLQIEDFLSQGTIVLFITLALIATLFCLLNGYTQLLFTLYIILANLALGFFILFQNIKNPINIFFFLITLSVVIWTLGTFFVWNGINYEIIFWGGRFSFFGAVLIPSFLLVFSFVFPKRTTQITFFRYAIILLPLFIFSPLVFMGKIKDVEIYHSNTIGIYGPAYPFFLFYVLSYISVFFYELWYKWKIFTGINRLQIKYVSMGFLFASLIAVTTNLIFPFVGISEFSFIGPHATIIMVAFVAYAIIRHRLMSTEIVIQKGLIYTIITSLIVTLYTLITLFSLEYFKSFFGEHSIIITIFTTLAIAVFYQPLVGFLQTTTDRWFFRRRYDYQKAMRDLSRAITTKLRLQELVTLVVTTFLESLNPVEISFLTLDSEKKRFRAVPLVATEKTSRYKRIEIHLESSVVCQLETKKEILVVEEMEDELLRMEGVRNEDQDKMVLLKENVAEMHRLGMSVWVPIILKENLIGIMLMGPKISGEIFTSEDLSLISTMSGQIAVALENARLYDHVVGIMNYHQDILDAMTSGVLTCDEKGTILTFNPMLEKMTGILAKDAIGKNFSELFKDNPAIKEVILNSLKGHAYMNFEKDLLGDRSQKIPVTFSTTRLKDQEGKRIGILLTIQDQAEIKELEGRLRRQDKLAALGTMAAGMAHEIKNPLSAMKVLSQLFPIKGGTEDYRKKFEEIMPREIGRIDRIVESLLSFAKASTPQFKDVDVVKIIDSLLDYYAEKMQSDNVKLVREIAPVPQIWADPEQLDKVFSNLILNAIQAMPQGGTLTVSLREGLRKDGELKNIYIDISDTGQGISKEAMKKLFDPFYTTKHGGTGLGLTITHSIIEGHGGTIDVSSEVNKGTAFAISLPIKQNVI